MKKTAKQASEKQQRDKKIQDIRKKLVLQKEDLIAGAGITMTALPSESSTELGDQASAEIDRNFTLRLRDRERKLLKKIEETIDMIDNGEYGICQGCACEITIKRLEARPVTTMCIDCKIEQEEEEKLRER